MKVNSIYLKKTIENQIFMLPSIVDTSNVIFEKTFSSSTDNDFNVLKKMTNIRKEIQNYIKNFNDIILKQWGEKIFTTTFEKKRNQLLPIFNILEKQLTVYFFMLQTLNESIKNIPYKYQNSNYFVFGWKTCFIYRCFSDKKLLNYTRRILEDTNRIRKSNEDFQFDLEKDNEVILKNYSSMKSEKPEYNYYKDTKEKMSKNNEALEFFRFNYMKINELKKNTWDTFMNQVFLLDNNETDFQIGLCACRSITFELIMISECLGILYLIMSKIQYGNILEEFDKLKNQDNDKDITNINGMNSMSNLNASLQNIDNIGNANYSLPLTMENEQIKSDIKNIILENKKINVNTSNLKIEENIYHYLNYKIKTHCMNYVLIAKWFFKKSNKYCKKWIPNFHYKYRLPDTLPSSFDFFDNLCKAFFQLYVALFTDIMIFNASINIGNKGNKAKKAGALVDIFTTKEKNISGYSNISKTFTECYQILTKEFHIPLLHTQNIYFSSINISIFTIDRNISLIFQKKKFKISLKNNLIKEDENIHFIYIEMLKYIINHVTITNGSNENNNNNNSSTNFVKQINKKINDYKFLPLNFLNIKNKEKIKIEEYFPKMDIWIEKKYDNLYKDKTFLNIYFKKLFIIVYNLNGWFCKDIEIFQKFLLSHYNNITKEYEELQNKKKSEIPIPKIYKWIDMQ